MQTDAIHLPAIPASARFETGVHHLQRLLKGAYRGFFEDAGTKPASRP